MDKQALSQMSEYLKKRKSRMRWVKLLCAMGAVIVFCTTYALLLPAITMEKTLVCEKTEHTHTDECYENAKTLICQLDETEGHSHGDECFDQTGALICAFEETEPHWHTEDCYETEQVLICTAEEHTHSDACYETGDTTVEEPEVGQDIEPEEKSDPAADVETAADWEATMADVTLTGDWRADVIAIARSQLGYQESTRNYIVLDNGKVKGYTRYGDWYGDTYGDWCAMFVSFCIYYADIPEVSFPQDANCADWVETLKNMELYRESGDYTPEPGDLVFFQKRSQTGADHVALVENVNLDGTITIIEGNSGYNNVREKTYLSSDADIIGFGMLEEEAVTAVIEKINHIPSADEIDAAIAEYEEADDMEGLEAWYTDVCTRVGEAYLAYSYLTEAQQGRVYNAQKLMELEYIWSAQTLIDEISSDAPTTAASADTSAFIDMNLYDYSGNINTKYRSNNKYPGFQWNGGAYMRSSYDRHTVDYIDFGNSMITDFSYGYSTSGSNGLSSNYQRIGNQGGDINKLDVNNTYGVTNRPIGMSLNASASDKSADVLSRTLGNDGYPALKDGTSLAYLFRDGTYASKQNTASINGLFQQDEISGEYHYNSRLNHAQYSNNQFTLYNQILTPNFIVYPFGNFLPFNDITNGSNATQVSKITSVGNYMQQIINDLWYATDYNSNSTKQQLLSMLAAYRSDLQSVSTSGGNAWTTWNSKNAIEDYFKGDASGDNPSDDTSQINASLLSRMYNIDFDVATNFFFGMDMTMNFTQPKDGMTGNDTNQDGQSDYPMRFYFTGDDDVWVYIDGVLFLDLSGIHRHVGGEIDFVNGKVHYYYLDTEHTGDVSTTPYQTYTFEEILRAAGRSTDGLNEKGTFKNYTTHEFKFYYMERGSGSSVCRLNFNFPLLKRNSVSVCKEVTSDMAVLGNPDYRFQVLKADASGAKTEELFILPHTSYTIYDQNNNEIGQGETDEYGVFTLKAGWRAEFNDIPENAGKYYVRELLDDTVLGQYGNITVSGESTTTSNNVTVGSDTFTGMESPVKDMSDGATSFRFTNDVDESKIGNLSISKVLTEYPKAREVKSYDIQVLLDGTPLPVGTKYTVGSVERTVETEGIITIAADETATISDILAGTAFIIQETSGSAEGYTVTYTEENGYTVENTEQAVAGIIKTSAHVKIKVTNAQKGTVLTIQGSKAMTTYDGTERTYSFRLDEVTDSTGATLKEGGIQNYTASVDVRDGPESFQFDISYVQLELSGLPAVFYYRITEQEAADTLANDTCYVAEVTVSLNQDGNLVAEVTGMWKDGKKMEESSDYSADFVNTLIGSLTLKKTVAGTAEPPNQDFSFTIHLDGVTDGSYPARRSGSDTVEQVAFAGGTAQVQLKHGESLTISQLPYGSQWTVTEDDADGYQVTTQITAGGIVTDGDEITCGGIITAGDTVVSYTNTVGYELPESGGMGTTWFMIGGLAILLGALLYHIRRRGTDTVS